MMTEMTIDDHCRVPRPLSLSSDDLLHEAERMFATKFVSRFPSSENIAFTHPPARDQNKDQLNLNSSRGYQSSSNSSNAPSSSATTTDGSPRRRATLNSCATDDTLSTDSDEHLVDDAPTIDDDDEFSLNANCHSIIEMIAPDLHGPLEVQKSVELVLYKWGPRIEVINPETFLLKILESRGYNCELVPALTSKYNR